MNFQSQYQNPLNSMHYQFQNLSLQNGAPLDPAIPQIGTAAAATQPLSRTASLMDSIGVQRASSPFVDPTSGLSKGHVLNQVAHQHTSACSSPYPSQVATPNVLHGGLFTGPASLAPPGVASAPTVPPLVVESQWRYIDTQGQIQGPFGSGPMSQWYASGYFQPSLQVARVGTSLEPFGINDRFVSLGELISKANNFQDPFHAFDLISASMLSSVGAAVGASSVQQQQQQREASKSVESVDYTHDEILQLKDPDGGYYRDVVVQVPTGSRKREILDDASVQVRGEDRRRDEMRRKKEEEKKKKEEAMMKSQKQRETLQEQEQLANTSATGVVKESAKISPAKEIAKDPVKEPVKNPVRDPVKDPIRETFKESTKAPTKAPTKGPTKAPVRESMNEPIMEFVKQKNAQAVQGVKVSIAPWAEKVRNAELPKIPSITELQKREERERQERERQERLAADKLKEQIIKEDRERQGLKSVLTWADKPKPVPANVGIKPHLKKEEKRKPSQAKAAVPLDEFNDPTFLKEQAKLWEEAQKSKTRRTTTTGASTNGNNAWTTVTSKSAKQAAVNIQQKPTLQPKSYLSPDKLRAIGANNTSNKQIGSSTSIPGLKARQTTPTPAYPGNASISARQEFLRWCRSHMQLNASVRKDAVLEVLLSLPAGGESLGIITDTINSNSNAMDGKRFAEEFIKRRHECEKCIKDPLTWSEVLSMPEGDDDDWEFQVVSKKKGRKH